MDLNLTLLGQMITFSALVIFTMKLIWPPLTKALEERQKKIADGLAAGERGEHELELAQHKATEQLRDAKIKAAKIIEQADKRSLQMVEQAKEQARTEGQRLLEIAQGDIEQERVAARQALSSEIAGIAILGAEKILGQSLDGSANNQMIERLISEVSGE